MFVILCPLSCARSRFRRGRCRRVPHLPDLPARNRQAGPQAGQRPARTGPYCRESGQWKDKFFISGGHQHRRRASAAGARPLFPVRRALHARPRRRAAQSGPPGQRHRTPRRPPAHRCLLDQRDQRVRTAVIPANPAGWAIRPADPPCRSGLFQTRSQEFSVPARSDRSQGQPFADRLFRASTKYPKVRAACAMAPTGPGTEAGSPGPDRPGGSNLTLRHRRAAVPRCGIRPGGLCLFGATGLCSADTDRPAAAIVPAGAPRFGARAGIRECGRDDKKRQGR